MKMLFEPPTIHLYNFHHPQQQHILCLTPSSPDVDELYTCDDFRMYTFKIRRCTKTRSHDWTVCPFAHRGEKATRRDPRRFTYMPISCPEFRGGGCTRGEACHFSHGVFEYWLHPAKYRTRVCNAGVCCQRKVCFFAHTPEELRREISYNCPYLCRREGEEELVEWVGEIAIGDGCGDGCEVVCGGEEWEVPDIRWVSELVS